jgi:hypothetical protein
MRTPTSREAMSLAEYTARRNMSLSMFRPMEHQEDFFRLWAREFLLRGGNRSNCEGTLMWKCKSHNDLHARGQSRPLNYSICKVEDLKVGDTIVGFAHQKRSDLRPAVVESIDVYPEPTYRLATKRGYELEGTHDHPVWACPPLPPRYNNSVDPDWKKSQWMLLRDVPEGWYVRMAFGSYVDWNGAQDDEAYRHGLMDGDGSVECYDYGVMKLAGHKDEDLIPVMQSHLSAAGVHSRVYESSENGVSLEWCNKDYKEKYLSWEMGSSPESMSSYLRGLFDADGCVTSDGKIVLIQKDTERVRLVQNLLLLFGIRCSTHLTPASLKHKRPNPIWRLQIGGFSVRRYAKSIGFGEGGKKEKLSAIVGDRREPVNGKLWWDRVETCGPTGETKNIVAISTSIETYISNGIVSHNSGKSTCAAVKFAAIATDTPITLNDGSQVNLRQPWQRNRPLRMWIVGYDYPHLGQTIYRLLFKAGLFKIIKDETTGLFRAYREWDEKDKAREHEAKPSPPLIPSRYVKPKSWVWENAKAKEFKKVVIVHPQTGQELCEIYAYSSKADPKAGDPVDVIWIDEKIDNAEHYPEWQARLTDNRGCLFWSSWPAITNDALAKLSERAKDEYVKDTPLVRELVITLSDNKALSNQAREEQLGMFSTPEERRARDQGEFVTDQYRAYPLFDEYFHQAIREGAPDELSKILSKNNFVPPNDWCHELILDPGTSHPGAILVAIPPPQFGDYYVVYDEIYPGRADAWQLAKAIKAKTKNRVFHRLIADMQGGRQTGMGYKVRVIDNYIDAFEKEKIRSSMTGYRFLAACPDIGARMGKLQEMMHINSKGFPKLRIMRSHCKDLCKQLTSYRKALVAGDIKDDRPAPGQRIDLAVCLEYGAASFPTYVKPVENIDDGGEEYAWYMKMFGNKKKHKQQSHVIGPHYAGGK